MKKFIKFLVILLYFNSLMIQASVQNCLLKWPLFYSENYNISFGPLDKMHPFEGQKYGKALDIVLKSLPIDNGRPCKCIITYSALNADSIKKLYFNVEKEVSQEDLLLVHTQEYLDSLNSSSVVAKVTEVSALAYLPNFIVQRYLLAPMRYATQGTIDALLQAYESKQFVINLGGGYHHAYADHGEGFCVYNDIAIAIKKLHQKYQEAKVLYVDLDAHQGNGVSSVLGTDSRVIIFDVFGKYNYPVFGSNPKGVKYSYPVSFGIKDQEYLECVELLENVIEQEKPDIIFYNAGTDILDGDALGRLKVSFEGVIRRDEMVFEYAQKYNIPLVMVTSGGYTAESASLIGRSIINLSDKKLFRPVR